MKHRPIPVQLEAFSPNSGQIAWVRSFIGALNDGAIWDVPSTGQRYKLDKGAKTLTLLTAVNSRLARQWHEMNKILFATVGYRVLDGPESAADEQAFAEAQCLVENLLNESPEMKTLKKNKVKLDPQEREQAIKAGATWHPENHDDPTCAVWKAVVNGKAWYVCNTHRCYQARSTLKGAISAFDYVKTTS